MKNDRDMDRLTDSVFAGGSDQAFREAVLRASLQASRTRRRNRAIGRGALLASLALVAGILLVRQRPPELPAPATTLARSRVRIIESRPLRPEIVARSRPDCFVPVATKAALANEVSDDQLLVMLRGQAIGLIREPGQPASLLLASGSVPAVSAAP
ncbi:MAG TPA: hypothetical protein VHH73_00405 [Verrucomicrobiae bacterium]|nr:hypothetical protein [Verrucomicrobiae bacterium]